MIDLVIPVYNDGENLLTLTKLISEKVKNKINLFICYDRDDDDLFNYLSEIKKTNLNVILKKKFT